MIAPNMISDTIRPLDLKDSGEKALMRMHEYNINQLPVVEGTLYAGLITIDEIINLKHLSKPIQTLLKEFRKPHVKNTAHIYDVMKAAVEYNIRVVPVTNEEGAYLGLISAESCLRAFATMNSIQQAGAVLELEIPFKEYQLSDVVRIVEENHAEVLSLYTSMQPETGFKQITLKLNTVDVGPIVQSLERYGYEMKAIHSDSGYSEDLKERFDALMRYLNV